MAPNKYNCTTDENTTSSNIIIQHKIRNFIPLDEQDIVYINTLDKAELFKIIIVYNDCYRCIDALLNF